MPSVLADAVFWIAVAACAVAQVAILRSVLAARAPERAGFPGLPGGPTPAVPAGSRAVETFWAVLPAVGLVVLLALTWRALHPAARPAARADRALPVAPAAPAAAEV
jgi:heme/copper-type cytochrome/quinol oxidase subunit 2